MKLFTGKKIIFIHFCTKLTFSNRLCLGRSSSCSKPFYRSMSNRSTNEKLLAFSWQFRQRWFPLDTKRHIFWYNWWNLGPWSNNDWNWWHNRFERQQLWLISTKILYFGTLNTLFSIWKGRTFATFGRDEHLKKPKKQFYFLLDWAWLR